MTRCPRWVRLLAGAAQLPILLGWPGVATADPPETPPQVAEPSTAAPSAGAQPERPSGADGAAREGPATGFEGFLRQTSVSGFVDAYYSWSANGRPPGELRNFDVTHNQLRFSVAEIAVDKKAIASSRLGFRVDVNGGPAAGMVNAGEPGGPEFWRAVQQAYVSYLVPVGAGLTVDAGKFVTPLGAEVIETRDNWNYSRSVLFSMAIPYYHFGARLAYPVADTLTLTGLVVNGWNNVKDNNDATTVGLSAAFAPTKRLTVVQNVIAGVEQPSGEGGMRRVFNTVATFAATSSLSLMGDLVVGHESSDGASRRWRGVAGYARVQPTDWFAVSPRYEWYSDVDGFTTGLVQRVQEATVTGEFKVSGVVVRLEARRDRSSQAAFASEDGLRRSRTTLAVGVLYTFSQPGR